MGTLRSVFVFDHSKKETFVSSWGLNQEMVSDEKRALQRIYAIADSPLTQPSPTHGRGGFFMKLFLISLEKSISKRPKNSRLYPCGDCYQVNLSHMELSNKGEIDSLSLFCELAEKYPAPFSVFLDSGETKTLSFFSEEFLTIRGREIITRPIKGTRKRKSSLKKMKRFKLNFSILQKISPNFDDC